MTGTAGNSEYYNLIWEDPETGGRYGRRLPRVTSVIKQTLAAPAINAWTYRVTRDNISGLVSVLAESGMPLHQIVDMLYDADDLEEVLKLNRLRPDDVMNEAGELGTEKHAAFERATKMGPVDMMDEAYMLVEHGEGHDIAIGRWLLKTQPNVVASEVRLVSWQHGYAGTCDLIHRTPEGLTVTDLKNRSADKPCVVKHKTEEAAIRCHRTGGPYDSDYVQTGAYEIAWNEAHPDDPIARRTVLVAKPDGEYVEEEATTPSSIFLNLLQVRADLRGEWYDTATCEWRR